MSLTKTTERDIEVRMQAVPKNIATALAAFQAELPKVTKSKTAHVETKSGVKYTYKYADLADVTEVVMPLLAKHGLSFSSKPTIDDNGRFVLAYVLRHSSGESDSGVYPLPSGSPQEIGSALTYARRYALSAITGVAAEEDDDGKAAKETRTESRPQKHWDPVTQDVLRAGWEAEIQDASTQEQLDDVSQRVRSATRPNAGEDQISPATADHLRKAWAEKRAELNGGERSGNPRGGDGETMPAVPQEAV